MQWPFTPDLCEHAEHSMNTLFWKVTKTRCRKQTSANSMTTLTKTPWELWRCTRRWGFSWLTVKIKTDVLLAFGQCVGTVGTSHWTDPGSPPKKKKSGISSFLRLSKHMQVVTLVRLKCPKLWLDAVNVVLWETDAPPGEVTVKAAAESERCGLSSQSFG